MKILLFSRAQGARVPGELAQIADAVRRFGFDFGVNEEFADAFCEATGVRVPAADRYGATVGDPSADTVMVCYGGDGTLLEGIRRLGRREIPVVGINSGRLGFLTSAPKEGIPELFECIAAGRLEIEPRTALDVEGDFGCTPETTLAVNEVAIQRNGASMISVDTYVDGQMVATYHGDGLIVCTPTGSTAYSLSAGGPVVAPACACFVLSPLAPHNLTMRPVVIPDSSRVTLRVHTRREGAFVSLDNRTYPISEGAAFRIERSECKILLAVPHNITFYETLRNKMMWGVDMRG